MPVYPATTYAPIVASGDTTGATDTLLIQAILGGPNPVLRFGTGTFYYNATLTVPANARLGVSGWGAATLKAASPFTFDASAAMINVTGAHAEIAGFQHLGGPSATFGSNPAGNFIQLQPGAQYTNIHDLGIYYQNGWEIEYAGGAGAGNIIGTMMRTLQRFQNKAGIHLKGSSASSWNGQVQITDVQAGQITGDSLFIEDIQDISVKGYNDSVVGAGGGAALHVKGNCSAILLANMDLGQFPNTGGNLPTIPTVLVEDSANGSPNGVLLNGGIVQQGISGIRVTGGATRFMVKGLRIVQNQQHGLDQQGTGFATRVVDCFFSSNGQAAGTFYEVSWSGTGTGAVRRCDFRTAQGAAGGGQVTAVGDFSGAGSNVEFDDNEIAGSGFTVANTFSANTPKFARRNKNYNPTGAVAITVPASGTAAAGRAFDMMFVVAASAAAGCALIGAGSPTRSFAAGTTNTSTNVTDAANSFTTDDIGKYVTGTGIPADTLITAVAAGGGSATISIAATATGTPTVTVAGHGVPAATKLTVYVPAGQTLTPRYTTAPSWHVAGL